MTADSTPRILPWALMVALACFGLAVWAGSPGTAEAKKKKSAAGKYTGPTQEGGTVSFQLTRNGTIVDFVLTNATLYCVTTPTVQFPHRMPEYTKVTTITHGPMRMQGASKKNPQGKKFEVSDPASDTAASQGGLFTGQVTEMLSGPDGGRVLKGTGMAGEVSYGTTNGPSSVEGTERCVTQAIDWEAKRPGTKGFVVTGGTARNPALRDF